VLAVWLHGLVDFPVVGQFDLWGGRSRLS